MLLLIYYYINTLYYNIYKQLYSIHSIKQIDGHQLQPDPAPTPGPNQRLALTLLLETKASPEHKATPNQSIDYQWGEIVGETGCDGGEEEEHD